jgi:hypothetical protein
MREASGWVAVVSAVKVTLQGRATIQVGAVAHNGQRNHAPAGTGEAGNPSGLKTGFCRQYSFNKS